MQSILLVLFTSRSCSNVQRSSQFSFICSNDCQFQGYCEAKQWRENNNSNIRENQSGERESHAPCWFFHCLSQSEIMRWKYMCHESGSTWLLQFLPPQAAETSWYHLQQQEPLSHSRRFAEIWRINLSSVESLCRCLKHGNPNQTSLLFAPYRVTVGGWRIH